MIRPTIANGTWIVSISTSVSHRSPASSPPLNSLRLKIEGIADITESTAGVSTDFCVRTAEDPYERLLDESAREVGLREDVLDALHGAVERFFVAGGDQNVQRLVHLGHHHLE